MNDPTYHLDSPTVILREEHRDEDAESSTPHGWNPNPAVAEQSMAVPTAEAPVDDVEAGFIEPVAMEADPFELFAGDTGVLEPEARNVLVDLLRRRYMFASRNPERWKALLENQTVIESRLHDLYVTLVIDRDRGIAYKKQVRSEEIDNPILLKDDPFNRAETILLVQLRALNQRGDGSEPIRVDGEELESQALTFFPETSGDLAGIQREIRSAIQRLSREGFLIEEAPGRYRITPLVEIVLTVDRLTELAAWLSSDGHSAASREAAQNAESKARNAQHVLDSATYAQNDGGNDPNRHPARSETETQDLQSEVVIDEGEEEEA